jgi:hypothetical protein
MLTQTLALFIDAYRELNAKKLFWITLVLSGLLVLAFAAVGINAQGLTIFHWEVPFALNTGMMSKEMFYKQILFTNLGVRFWLGWGAAILALVSTAGMIPDFVTGGSLPVMLAKPVSRLRLFLTKYVSGLLFVALQVTVFCTASFFVLGLRASVWEPSLFVAVPLVIAFFSFLFCVCALVGLLTRSTIAALIITAIFWFMLFAVNTSEQALLMFRTYNEQRVQAYDAQIEQERQRMQAVSGEASNGIMNALKDGLLTREGRESRIARLEERREEVDRLRRGVTKWHNGVFIAKTILPKTTETVQLTERTLVDMAELDMMMDDNGPDQNMPESREDRDLGVRIDNDDVTRELIRKQRSRSVAWIVGTSLLFEAFILAIACWVFCRRDY